MSRRRSSSPRKAEFSFGDALGLGTLVMMKIAVGELVAVVDLLFEERLFERRDKLPLDIAIHLARNH
jgi:hypothetical protein